MYFSHFPKIIYDANGTGQFKGVTNLLRRVAVRSKVKENTVMYDTYDVQEGETPESIADKLYDDFIVREEFCPTLTKRFSFHLKKLLNIK